MEAPFFHVPGNHDVEMQTGRDGWMERHGSPYYHFLYKDVLFLVLDSIEGPSGALQYTINSVTQTNDPPVWTVPAGPLPVAGLPMAALPAAIALALGAAYALRRKA